MAKTKGEKVEAPKPTPFTFRRIVFGKKTTPNFHSACPKCNK